MYLLQIEKGKSKYKAGKIFTTQGLSDHYYIRFDNCIQKYYHRAKIFFPDKGNPELHGLPWLRTILSTDKDLLLKFNYY